VITEKGWLTDRDRQRLKQIREQLKLGISPYSQLSTIQLGETNRGLHQRLEQVVRTRRAEPTVKPARFTAYLPHDKRQPDQLFCSHCLKMIAIRNSYYCKFVDGYFTVSKTRLEPHPTRVHELVEVIEPVRVERTKVGRICRLCMLDSSIRAVEHRAIGDSGEPTDRLFSSGYRKRVTAKGRHSVKGHRKYSSRG
jgi:hypothetical protein